MFSYALLWVIRSRLLCMIDTNDSCSAALTVISIVTDIAGAAQNDSDNTNVRAIPIKHAQLRLNDIW